MGVPIGLCHNKYNLLEYLLTTLNQFVQLQALFNMRGRFGRPVERLSEMTNAFGEFLRLDTPEIGGYTFLLTLQQVT